MIRISVHCILATRSAFIHCFSTTELTGGAISLSSVNMSVDINSCLFELCYLQKTSSKGGAVYAFGQGKCTMTDCCVIRCYASIAQTFMMKRETKSFEISVVQLTAFSCGTPPVSSDSGFCWSTSTTPTLKNLNFSWMYTQMYGSAFVFEGDANISSLTIISCTGSTAVTDLESGDQTIEYGNFVNNTILNSSFGRLATIGANYNGLSLSHCWFSGNDADLAAFDFKELGHLFSLSYCFFSDSFPDSNLSTIVTECYENLLTASWAMSAPTQDIEICVRPCTIESFSFEDIENTVQSRSLASYQSEMVSDSFDATVSPSRGEFMSESPNEGPSERLSDDCIQSVSDSLPDTLSPSVEAVLSQSPTESPSDSSVQFRLDSLGMSLFESPTESLVDTTTVTENHSLLETHFRFISVSALSLDKVTHSGSDSTDSGKVVNPPIPSQSADPVTEDGLSIGVIIGIIAGVIVLIAGGVVAGFFQLRRRTQTSQRAENEMTMGNFSDLNADHLATFANALSADLGDLWQEDGDEID
jgi:hypothetical protein